MDELRGYDAKWNNHTEKEKYHMISLQCGIWKTKQAKQMKSLTRTEKRRVVARGDGLWRGEGIIKGN